MGVSIKGNYSHVWFGKEDDQDGYHITYPDAKMPVNNTKDNIVSDNTKNIVVADNTKDDVDVENESNSRDILVQHPSQLINIFMSNETAKHIGDRIDEDKIIYCIQKRVRTQININQIFLLYM